MISNPTIQCQEHIASWKSSICKKIISTEKMKVLLACIFKYSGVCCTTLPPAKNVEKLKIPIADCKDILRNKSLLVVTVNSGLILDPTVEL
jgi:hypothetical protein